MVHHHEPTYVFRLTHELALRWATLSILLFFVSVAGVSGFYQAIHGQTWTLVSASNQTNQWSALVVFLGFIAVLFGQIIIHELIHGVAFAAFGGSPRYGVGVKFFLPYAYATSPGTRFSRNAYLVIDLAPLVVIDLLCLVLVAIFPQAAWLGLVVVFNTSGASGDLWMATLLLRCPASIEVEDRHTGMAIYAPPDVDFRSLPFKTSSSKTRSALWVWGNVTLLALMVVFLGSFLLMPVFQILQVPSFVLGTDSFWIMRWQNDEQGVRIGLNVLSILAIAAFIGLMGILAKVIN
ncbi:MULTISPECIES: DUF3267 domain-containing protein [Fischerella]|uniref:DUF3267 domain-containing protein n=1 Tax=Fischerella TaxID=1190 RepID=UPI0003787C5F|nr:MULTISPECIES: DUF3267 domain-containing protein [Fischerella]MBD2431456.1 DUF3267 domain-containing protein [Fischerella sp. FACHB-380]